MLTPIGLDPAHPFPRMLNKSLNFIVELDGPGRLRPRRRHRDRAGAARRCRASCACPDDAGARARLRAARRRSSRRTSSELFPGMRGRCGCYAVPRDPQQRPLRRRGGGRRPAERARRRAAAAPLRRRGAARGRRTTARRTSSSFLLRQFELAETTSTGSTARSTCAACRAVELVDRPDLKYPPFRPGVPRPARGDATSSPRSAQRDMLLHHPYQSFAPVMDFVAQAARRPEGRSRSSRRSTAPAPIPC